MENKKPHRHVYTYGKNFYKPTVSPILVCECGNKYLKTRENQTKCVKCLGKAALS